jgi:hypothetical protein
MLPGEDSKLSINQSNFRRYTPRANGKASKQFDEFPEVTRRYANSSAMAAF